MASLVAATLTMAGPASPEAAEGCLLHVAKRCSESVERLSVEQAGSLEVAQVKVPSTQCSGPVLAPAPTAQASRRRRWRCGPDSCSAPLGIGGATACVPRPMGTSESVGVVLYILLCSADVVIMKAIIIMNECSGLVWSGQLLFFP